MIFFWLIWKKWDFGGIFPRPTELAGPNRPNPGIKKLIRPDPSQNLLTQTHHYLQIKAFHLWADTTLHPRLQTQSRKNETDILYFHSRFQGWIQNVHNLSAYLHYNLIMLLKIQEDMEYKIKYTYNLFDYLINMKYFCTLFSIKKNLFFCKF